MQRLFSYYRSYGSTDHGGEVSQTQTNSDDNLDSQSQGTIRQSNLSMADEQQTDFVASEYYISITSDTAKSSPTSSVAVTEESSCSEDMVHSHSAQASNLPTKRKIHRRNSSIADKRLSMVSNFSAAYNTVNISLALVMMQSVHPPEDSSAITTCSSALIAGMIFGQLGGGLLGDWLGRHAAMAVVMSLQVGAAFMSAWSGMGIIGSIMYTELACWRFLLGVGCGGVYPLAATITAESASESQNKGRSVALTFSMQGVGYLAVSLVAYFLVSVLGEESDLAWRLLLGIGCLPGLVLIGVRLHRRARTNAPVPAKKHLILKQPSQEIIGEVSHHDVHTTVSQDTNELTSFNQHKAISQVRLKPISLMEQISNEPNLFRKIIGTAGCWLLFDILFYGNTLFQPVVLSTAFGESETIYSVVCDSVFIALVALPGYFVSVAMVGRQSPKRIQLQGFICMAVLYTIIGLKFGSLKRLSLLGLYGSTFFFSNYGPNSTTFMLPSMTFSRPCRSTLNGICAASGKIGALLGSSIFLPLASWLGNAEVMILCALVSIVGAILTFIFVDDDAGASEESMECRAEIDRVSSETHLLCLQEEVDVEESNIISGGLPKTVSMPTFLDLE